MISAPTFIGPDWFSRRLPVWLDVLAPLLARAERDPLRCLEVGSYEGRSAMWMLDRLIQHPDAALTCVDLCEDPERAARLEMNLRIASAETERVRLFRGPSRVALPALMHAGDTFDLAYIDGSHEAPDVLFDAVLSFEMLVPGGILIFDDYLWSPGNLDGGVHAPQLAIDAFTGVNAERLRVLHRGAQVIAEKL